jgi:hypothetical protein
VSPGAVAMTAIIVSGAQAAVSTAALAYVVRRVAPQPKLPAPPPLPGSGSSRRLPPADTPAPGIETVAGAGNGPDPAPSTAGAVGA